MEVRHPNYEKTEIDYNELLRRAAPAQAKIQELESEAMVLNMGPQHPSTHGVLRMELVLDGEVVVDVIPHLGYLHRCFEKHAESLPIPQIIPYTDRLDYLASMNNNLAFVLGVEKMMGLEEKIPKRVHYIRVLVSELNRIASHMVAIGTFGMDIGAWTPFLWCFRDRDHILNLLEWASGARMLYNYIWVGGIFYDLPVGFEQRAREFVEYFKPRLQELNELLTGNRIFIERTANVGVLPLKTAISYGCSGPVLRGSGLQYDLRKIDGYAVYDELDFEVPVGKGEMGQVGDCWDRYRVRALEVAESLKLIEQCVDRLEKDYPRTEDFDPRGACPPKARPPKGEIYARAENPKGELGFYFMMEGKKDVPFRCKVRAPSFSNLNVVQAISKGVLLADLVAILGSTDIVLGEVDR